MNELQEFKNLFEEEIKKNIILILLEELTKELKKEEAKKNDNIDNN